MLRGILMQSYLGRLLKHGVQKAFSRHLFLTNVTISFSLSGIGDVIQQYYRISCKEQRVWDKTRTQTMTLTGVTVGVLCHHWYQLLDKKLPGRAIKTILKKLMVDQIVFSPICILVFIGTLNLLRNLRHILQNGSDTTINPFLDSGNIHKKFLEFKEDVSDKGIQLYLAEWVIWPPAQLINFYYLPSRYRVLYDNSLSLLYDVYTSHVVHHSGSDSSRTISSLGVER